VPAQLAYVREVVKEDQLLQASTLQNIMFQIAKVVGPFLGAAALTITTPKACILVNAAACMISISVLFSLKKAGKNIQGQAARSSHQTKETFRLTHKNSLRLYLKLFFIDSCSSTSGYINQSS